MITRSLTTIVTCTLLPLALSAQTNIGTGKVADLYTQYCVTCHGENLQGGLGKSLLEPEIWTVVGKSRSFLDYVQKGDANTGMPSFEATLDEKQIRSLEIFIQEKQQQSERATSPVPVDNNGIYSTSDYKYRLETIVDGLALPWSVEFLPNGDLLISERAGNLRVFSNGKLSSPISGLPEIWAKGQGGLMDIGIHPDYSTNGWIYISYSEQSSEGKGMTAVARGRLKDGHWVDNETVLSFAPELHTGAGVHWGTRLVFKDGYLFFGIGDRGAMHKAQDLSTPNGKIHRVHDDGRIPADNPFADNSDALPSIWALGVRNPQGMVLSPDGSEIWESEHGPRGGDEINRIEAGKNYGWPKITYGMHYNGAPITDKTAAPGLEQPAHYWTPSISVCGIDFYTGDDFPMWQGELFAGGLRSEELHRLTIKDGKVVAQEIVLKGAGRIRDVRSSPTGHLYLVLNGKQNSVVRLVPAE
ncbi:PQQ-dependent sugar dehydrogenase [Coraliomargarita akajimensis]|uniref:Glucose sorbosone dehydrogenase n=1 Tax=Coraliomargarita akajimensis (strain DSM 45221 / IAM 15411 / JCM 23193 / KCTC 12865 / 04OKA010-24) TaxID=583355 RepID=D5EHS4_CORAD|nr:PQQ-dependent sugar dehydrogenase [Coraliomargarita akajimensis]ADE54115.1 glucose sorbosone dehydrogenase [Coraliomargarita akajimensis DSM 45221]